MSIAANIAEGNGRFTKPDRRNFFTIARGSVQECVPLMDVATRHGLIKSDRHDELKADLEEIARMLAGLIKGLDKRAVIGRALGDRSMVTRVRWPARTSVADGPQISTSGSRHSNSRLAPPCDA